MYAVFKSPSEPYTAEYLKQIEIRLGQTKNVSCFRFPPDGNRRAHTEVLPRPPPQLNFTIFFVFLILLGYGYESFPLQELVPDTCFTRFRVEKEVKNDKVIF